MMAHAIVGPGFVLDDWFLVRNATFDGALGVVGPDLRAARPGSLLTYVLVFGIDPRSPWASLIAQGAIFLCAVVLVQLVLQRVLGPRLAMAITTLWVLLPSHLSVETWPSAVVATASLVLLAGGVLVLLQRPTHPVWLGLACLLLAASCLTYEASIVPASAAFVLAPWWTAGRLQWRTIAAGAATLGAVALWQVLNWHSVKSVQRDLAAYDQVLQAHFGWGIVSYGWVASCFLVIGLAGVVTAAVRLTFPSFRGLGGYPERLVIGGAAVVVAGSISFSLYFYAPVGAGDRVNYVSSIGGAAVWVGIAWMLQRFWRPLGLLLLVALVAAGVWTRWDRTALWATAKSDADRILEEVQRTDPACDVVTLGPAPIQRQNVAAFLDQSNVDAAVQIALGRREVAGVITFSEAQFLKAPAECRVDIRPLSKLEPDVVVAPT